MADADERRRVAERLRAQARTVSHDSGYLWKRLEIAVNGWKYGDAIDESYALDNDVLLRLADLIDPTCGDGWSDAQAVEALEYIYALESALVQLSSEGERKKIVSLMCAVRERFAPRLSEKLYDWTKGVMVDD
ncbi:hypothetical protein [Parafannyhessea umbonata]|uniref:hypothetical protein n=1 Tax=Parafannyhessea umbonata TaxID=604330 RepID=UPI00359C1A10